MARVQHDDDVDAFACLYDRCAARACGVALSLCHDTGRAEDAVQEAFLAIWRGRMNFSSASGSFAAWAMVIVRHRAIDIGRGESARPKLSGGGRHSPDRADATAASLPDDVIGRESAERLRASLRRLPDVQAEVIALAFFGELSHAEIAEALSLPQGTVKGRMRLGLAKLRQQLVRSA